MRKIHRGSAIIRWRKYNDRYMLTGNKCKKCEKIYYPAKQLCECGSMEFAEHKLVGKGKLLTFTEIKTAPSKFASKTPYCVGIIELEEGPKIAAQIADCTLKELGIEMEVEASFRKFYDSGKSGVIHYGTKFVPSQLAKK